MSKRLPAEWEKQHMVQLTLPHADTDWADCLEEALACFVRIAAAIVPYQKVLIVARNLEQARPLFAPLDQSKLLFAELDNNDTWARDHGGITILEAGQPVVLDFVFNGWGLKFAADKDNLLTAQLHRMGLLKGEYRHGGMVLEGGGIESDGHGTLLTTEECLLSPNRNPHWSKAEIEAQLKACFGLERVLWLKNGFLSGDDTDSHIDTLARLCAPDTIAYVKCDDPTDEHFEALRAMETELKAFRTAEGEPYQLVPLPWPDACYADNGHRLPATYANFLIINGAVLVPVYGVPQDEAALAALQPVFPDRSIIGVDCRVLIEQHGSLHCVTMQYYA
jgi:agmatine deiminase